MTRTRRQRRKARAWSGAEAPRNYVPSPEDRAFLREALDRFRPRRRSECARGLRPCPWVGCRYHLYVVGSYSDGRLKVISSKVAGPWEMSETCALDVVARHPQGVNLEDLADLLYLSHERVRQIEEQALEKIKKADELGGWEEP